jgi:hypothetical protein
MSLMPNMPDLHADTIGALLARGRRLKRAGFMLDEMLDLLGLDEVTWYRYQADYGALAPEQLRELRKLEAENQRLRLAVSQLMLDKLVLEEAAWGPACAQSTA